MSTIHDAESIEYLRTGGAINAAIHRRLYEALRPGVSTADLDRLAGILMEKAGVTSSIVAEGFPGYICVSINDEIGHGVPGSSIIRAGDVVKIDIAIRYRGFHTDCAQSYIVETGSKKLESLLYTGKQALWSGISNARAKQRCSDISAAIHQVIVHHNCNAVRRVFGHGIGTELHESPSIANYGPAKFGQRLHSGMVLAIEPIVNVGTSFTFRSSNGWTDITTDGACSAHFEHTVLVTDGEPEVLTRAADNRIRTYN